LAFDAKTISKNLKAITVSLLPIIIVPDPVLKQVAQPIEKITPIIQAQAENMIETMYNAPGIGLAANQVGQLNRIFVMDVDYRKDPASRNPITMINPEIVWKSEEISVMEEGCLSIPQQYAEVERPRTVRVRYVNLQGQFQEMEGSDLTSHCIQHELDHLNGILFIDYLSRLKRNMLLRKLEKSLKDNDKIL
jgi:peptide deformylase